MSKLKFNGLYYHLDTSSNTNYILRFFEKNNLVISVSIIANEGKKLSKKYFPQGDWFNEFYEQNGNYTISGNKISFVCSKVSYEGIILNSRKLSLFSHSYINGYESTKEYKYISFNDIKKLGVDQICYLI